MESLCRYIACDIDTTIEIPGIPSWNHNTLWGIYASEDGCTKIVWMQIAKDAEATPVCTSASLPSDTNNTSITICIISQHNTIDTNICFILNSI